MLIKDKKRRGIGDVTFLGPKQLFYLLMLTSGLDKWIHLAHMCDVDVHGNTSSSIKTSSILFENKWDYIREVPTTFEFLQNLNSG